MPTFLYRVKTRQGGVRRGKLEAVDHSAALRALRQQDLFVTRLREEPASLVQGWSFSGTVRVSQNDLMVFTYQLEALIKAGVPLAQGLDMLATQASSSAFQAVIRAVKQKVESGSSLAGALQGHPTVFTPWYVNMVEAGEESGTLDQTFGRVAEHLDKVGRLRQQVKLALAYPLLVMTVAVLVLWVLLLWVIPMFATMFADWGDALPWPTALVLAVSRWLQAHWVPVLLGVAGLGIGGRVWSKTRSGQGMIEDVMLRVPLAGKLWRNVAVVHVTRTLGVLLRSGVPILRGLEIAQKVSGLRRMALALEEAKSSIREGHTLADPLERSGMFPRLVSNMVGVGEATGNLDMALENVADLYEREVDRDVAAFTAVLEPLIIVVLGIGIGFIVVAMYLPIFSMPSVFD
ncbi:MAG: type II secretion system F family protein [Nitrospira sp.]|nr:type II secretion system F family protein [Nitrospira sp.]